MSNKRFNKDRSFEYVKKSPFNTDKKIMIVDPKQGVMPIEEYGKSKNFPGKIIRVLNAKGGRAEKPISRNKKNYRPTKSGAGMTRAGVAAYRRANPGSKLKTAVTGKVKPGSKAAKRRKSYCARSLGQLKRASAKTRNDPNSRIRQARRRWKC